MELPINLLRTLYVIYFVEIGLSSFLKPRALCCNCSASQQLLGI